MGANDRKPPGPQRSRSTTRRCATEPARGHLADRRRQAPHRRAARPLGVHYIEGGWPGANPKDDEFFARARPSSSFRPRRSWPSAPPAAPRARSTRTRPSATCAARAPASSASSASAGTTTSPRRSDHARRGRGHGRRLGRVSGGQGRGSSSTPSTSSTATSKPRVLAAGPRGRRDGRRRAARALRHQRRLAPTRGRGGRRAWSPCRLRRRRPPAQRHGLRDRQRHRRGAGGRIQVQGTINGYGERTGNCDLVPDHRQPQPQDGDRDHPERPHRAPHLGVAPRGRAGQLHAAPQQPYTGKSAFAHKAGLHTSAISRRPDAYEHVSPERVGNGTRFVVSEMAGRSTLELKAQSSASRLDGKAWAMSSTRSSGSSTRATTSRSPTPRSSC